MHPIDSKELIVINDIIICFFTDFPVYNYIMYGTIIGMFNKEKFEIYKSLILDYSRHTNLVSKKSLENIEIRHFEDSKQLSNYITKGSTIIDMGSGAGFPGVVLAILGYKVFCVESIIKKANFLNLVKNKLNLKNLIICNERLENFLKNRTFDKKTVFTARAFAPLIEILEYIHIFNYPAFLLKGRKIEEEIFEANKKFKFYYELKKSITGDGFIIKVEKIKKY